MKNKYEGPTLDSFLKEERIFTAVTLAAKRNAFFLNAKKSPKRPAKKNIRVLHAIKITYRTMQEILRFWRAYAKRLMEQMQKSITPKKLEPAKATWNRSELRELNRLLDRSYNELNIKFFKQVRGVRTLETVNLASIKKKPEVYDAFKKQRAEHIHYFKKYPVYAHKKLVRHLEESVKKVEFHGVKVAESALPIAKALKKSDDIARRHAAFIARDQLAKFNSSIHEAQARSIGDSKKYIWSTSQDERVRPLHARLEGKIFDYVKPPVTNEKGQHNNPGMDFQCRCVSLPIIDI